MAEAIKLRLSELGLYGREHELSIFQECYHRVEGNNSDDGDSRGAHSEVVLVSGGAGTGKSTLVLKAANDIMNAIISDRDMRSGPIYVSGKFVDQRKTTGQRPYAAVCAAFSELVKRISDAYDETKRRQMGEEIHKAIGSGGLEVLETVVPGAQRLLLCENGLEKSNHNEESAVVTASAVAVNRLKFALRSFLRSVCSQVYPVILFLDDLQWADQASLELFRSVATDTKLRHLLLVGAYREEEVDGKSHPLAVICQDIETEKLRGPVTRIRLGDLPRVSLTKLLVDMLRCSDVSGEVSELSGVVHQRTRGNPFFVLQFLSMLQDRHLLVYSLSSYTWTWDVERIRSETEISDNVVGFVALQIQDLSPRIAKVLKLMACLPSNQVEVTFLESILQGLDKQEFGEASKDSNLVQILEEAKEKALVDRVGSDSFKFTHDRIREGAYLLIPAGREREMFHFRIGEVLLDMLTSSSDQQSLKFIAADQLNRGAAHITDEKQRLDLASLNLDAGMIAISAAAFVPAAEFFAKGLVLLHNVKNHWKNNHDLSLKLCTLSIEMANVNGDFDLLKSTADEVTAHANGKCSQETLRVYCILVESLTVQQKIVEAMSLAYDILAQLGQCFPKSFLSFHAHADYQKMKKMLQGYSDQDILSLPRMKDENMIVASRLMSHLDRCTYFMQDMASMSILCFRNLQCMLRFGLNEDTPYMLSKYGMLLCGGLGDIKEGCRFGALSLKLLDRFNEREAVVVLVVHSFVLHWQSPVHDRIDPLFRASSIGMAKGDINHAFLCVVGYMYFFYHSGLPLESFEKDSRGLCEEMRGYKQDLALIEVLPLWQGALNLMGKSDDPLILSGEAMTQDEFLRDAIPTAKQKVYLMRMQLAYYFGDIDLALEMLESCEKLMLTIVAHMVYEIFTFFCGLIYLDQARKKGKRIYKKLAYSKIQKMRKWVKDGAVNCVHKLLLLEAEYAALNRGKRNEKDKIKKAYDSAISVATRSGFVHDAALANERAGIWFHSLRDDFWASSYLSRAYGLYNEWGATAKANRLDQQWSLEFALKSDKRESGRSVKGKSRFDRSTSERHKSMDFTVLSSRMDAGSDSMRSSIGEKSHLITSRHSVSSNASPLDIACDLRKWA